VPLTPTDVANKQFNIKMRGYALDEVDAFLDEVEGELARLLRDNNELRNRGGSAAPAAVPAPQSAEPAPAAAAAPASSFGTEGQEAALRTLLLAQRTADEAVAEARAEAAQIVSAAQTEAEQLRSSSREEAERTVAEARAEAERTLTAARTEAEQTLTTARTEAEQLRSSSREEADRTLVEARAEADRSVTGAREQAAAMQEQAAARVQSMTGDLEVRRSTLESQIEELRAFEREYRTRLRAYLENQLRDLVGPGSDDDSGAGVPAGAGARAVGLQPAAEPSRPAVAAAPQVGPFGSEPPTADDAEPTP
jgi:DivIVA domain-containing protein